MPKSAARIVVQKNGAGVGRREILDLVQGAGVTLTVTDDPGNRRVRATIATAGGNHAMLSNLAWAASGHTGAALAVAAWGAAGAAAPVASTADGQVLQRQGGALVWATLAGLLAVYQLTLGLTDDTLVSVPEIPAVWTGGSFI